MRMKSGGGQWLEVILLDGDGNEVNRTQTDENG